jgi:hypothetical protein
MASAPVVGSTALRGHDAVVRRLAQLADPLLPARFGTLVATDADLCERLTRPGDRLRDALARVTGREQMILRVYVSPERSAAPAAPEAAAEPADEASGDLGPGARYLAERARAQRASCEVGELAPIRPVLDRFVSAERVERHHASPLVASVYHLLARGTAAAYTAAVEEAARAVPGIRVTVSGPWAPYAFAPEALG